MSKCLPGCACGRHKPSFVQPHTAETKARISAAMKGKPGQPKSIETRAKIGAASGRTRRNGLSEEDHFWTFVLKGEGDECYLWTGGTSRGYGPHRRAYVIQRPDENIDGLHLHHRPTCPKTCIRAEHLTPMTLEAHQAIHKELR